jgi:hypothetical protein
VAQNSPSVSAQKIEAQVHRTRKNKRNPQSDWPRLTTSHLERAVVPPPPPPASWCTRRPLGAGKSRRLAARPSSFLASSGPLPTCRAAGSAASGRDAAAGCRNSPIGSDSPRCFTSSGPPHAPTCELRRCGAGSHSKPLRCFLPSNLNRALNFQN